MKKNEPTPLEKRVINNIRRIRREKGISQIRLAAFCDTSTSYIGLMESYKNIPKISTIERIAEALNVSPEELFKENEEESAKPKLNIERVKSEIMSALEKNLDEILRQI